MPLIADSLWEILYLRLSSSLRKGGKVPKVDLDLTCLFRDTALQTSVCSLVYSDYNKFLIPRLIFLVGQWVPNREDVAFSVCNKV